jgi:CRP-like cAMP-binding protein
VRSDRKLNAGDVVFGQGDPSDAIFYIRTGRIQLTVVSDQGKEGVIALFGPGDFFGEGCLAGQPVRMASASATLPSDITRIEKAAMVRLLHDKPEFSENFMGFLLQRNIQVEADLVDQLFNSSEKRLARLLLLLASFSNDGELRPIAPKISQEVLAARVGTTRSRVNYFMNKFRKLGLIEYNGTIKVHTALINVIVHD